MIVEKSFMVNRHLARMVEHIKELQEKQVAKRKRGECEKHQEPFQLFCKEDEVLVCMKCDRSMEHQGHNVLPVYEVSESYKEQLRDHMNSLKDKQEEYYFLEETKETRMKSFLDIKNTLSSFERRPICSNVDLSPRWEEKLRIYSQKNSELRKALESHKESLVDALDKANLEQVWGTDTLKKAMDKESVTLDRKTAHHLLVVSKDQKTVTFSLKYRILTDNIHRFDWDPCVLGCTRFMSGRHRWEVEVKVLEIAFAEDLSDNPPWAVGVARDSVNRKGPIDFNPIKGIWAIGELASDISSPCQVSAFTFPKPTSLKLKHKPRKIQVTLDYEEGWVDFFDVETDEYIFTFYAGTFAGQAIRPFFCSDFGLSL
ncbi:hypothetical protein JD844_013499 [Phrynosoma platyrhinos]|uniref:Uncharacterized protein n=1 Tax=Phrynosoma platyrhinos TaxID=52577 RepID=A0ABQ7TMR8_PHRPL|nr:hypothetical protein JD844_013499 [Phrynosoma platyrhinos]